MLLWGAPGVQPGYTHIGGEVSLKQPELRSWLLYGEAMVLAHGCLLLFVFHVSSSIASPPLCFLLPPSPC